MRLIAEFEKIGPAAYISHLDLQRVMGRALRRAKAPIKYSQGFNPHVLMSFATALSVGCESVCEILDLPLEYEDKTLPQTLNANLPRGSQHAFRAIFHLFFRATRANAVRILPIRPHNQQRISVV